MIKILFLIERLTGGGAEKVLCNLVNHMDQTKFEITVQTIWPYEASKYLVPGIRYKAMYPSESSINRFRYRAEAESGLAYRLHIKDDYDVECAYLEMGPTKIMASSTNKKAKKLAWVHCDLTRAIADPQTYVEKTASWYSKFDRIVCVSQNVKASFDRFFHSAYPSDVLHNVIEEDVIREKSLALLPGVSKRRLTMLAVGTMYPPKNYPRLLRTHQTILEEGIEHDLWILGDGEQRPQIEQFIQENKLQESVKLFGFQNNPYPYMKVADVIVCSSNYEGFSTVITESTILGKAIVTTDCSGMREILGDSEFGLVTENSDEAFYEGVKRMLSDPNLREEYARRAAIRGNHFSTGNLVSRTENYFERLVQNEL